VVDLTQETVEIRPAVAEVLTAAAAATAGGAVWVLPRYVEEGIGLYPDEVQFVPKEMRHAGLPVDFAQPTGQRRVLSEYSEDLVFQIALGVAGNVTWDVAKNICSYLWARVHTLGGHDAGVAVEIDTVYPDGTLEGVRVTGLADDATALQVIRVLSGREGPDEH
jgi:hypothetical protein